MKKTIIALALTLSFNVAASAEHANHTHNTSDFSKVNVFESAQAVNALAPIKVLDVTHEQESYRALTELKQTFTLPKILWELDVSPYYSDHDKAKAHDEAIFASDKVHPELKDFQKRIRPAVYQLSDNVYQMQGFEFTNSTIIVGDTGLIVFDTHYSNDTGRMVLEKFREVTGIDKPVHTIVYSHHHPDQHSGTAAYVSHDDIAAGKINVIAHDTFMDNLALEGGFASPIMSQRGAYAIGPLLEVGPEGFVNQGVGTTYEGLTDDRAKGTYTATPNLTFDDKITILVDGVEMEMFHVPGEAADHIAIYLPKSSTLLAGDAIQGETVPNLYTIRGTKFRDAGEWMDSVDRMRRYHPTGMTNHHGRAVDGAQDLESVLLVWRDSLQYMQDQSIRLMNEGQTRDELAENIQLPEQVASHDYLRPVRGSVEQNVKNIYTGYLGWFNGDPTEHAKPAFTERAALYVEQLGGRDKIIKTAKEAVKEGSYGWAMDITTWVIRVNPEDQEARNVKAEAMRQWGFEQSVPGWRNWALTGAIELENGDFPLLASMFGMSTEQMYELDLENMFKILRVKFDPSKVKVTQELLNISIDGSQYVFGIRNGNLIANKGTMPGLSEVVVTKQDFVNAFFFDKTAPKHKTFKKVYESTRVDTKTLSIVGR